MAKAGHKYITYLHGKKIMSRFHLHVASIFMQFQLDFNFEFKLSTYPRLAIRRHSPVSQPVSNILKIQFKKSSFKSYFHFHAISIFMQFQFAIRFGFKLPTRLRRALGRPQMSEGPSPLFYEDPPWIVYPPFYTSSLTRHHQPPLSLLFFLSCFFR